MKITHITWRPSEDQIIAIGLFNDKEIQVLFPRESFGELSEEERYRVCEEILLRTAIQKDPQ